MKVVALIWAVRCCGFTWKAAAQECESGRQPRVLEKSVKTKDCLHLELKSPHIIALSGSIVFPRSRLESRHDHHIRATLVNVTVRLFPTFKDPLHDLRRVKPESGFRPIKSFTLWTTESRSSRLRRRLNTCFGLPHPADSPTASGLEASLIYSPAHPIHSVRPSHSSNLILLPSHEPPNCYHVLTPGFASSSLSIHHSRAAGNPKLDHLHPICHLNTCLTMRSRSSSSTSSSSTTSLSADNIQVFINLGDGKSESGLSPPTFQYLPSATVPPQPELTISTALPLNVTPHQNIDTVLKFLHASETIPSDVRLLYAGHQVDRQSTIGELDIQPQSTLHLLGRLRGGHPSPPPEAQATSTVRISPPPTQQDIDKPNTEGMTGSLDTIPPQQPACSQHHQEPQDHTQPPAAISQTQTPPLPTSGTSTPTPTPSVSSTSSTPKPKSNRPRCGKQGCKAPAQPIVGDCGFCAKRFCGKHRMLEAHNCEGLDDARQADKDRNAAKLEGERTVMLRGL